MCSCRSVGECTHEPYPTGIDVDRILREQNARDRAMRVERALHHEPVDGVRAKYHIQKNDGSPVDKNARYLVLRIDGKDEGSAERKALETYLAVLADRGEHKLAEHLRVFFSKHTPHEVSAP